MVQGFSFYCFISKCVPRLVLIFGIGLATACNTGLRWGLVLWTKEYNTIHLSAGNIVVVYSKSAIQNSYEVGLPGGKVRTVVSQHYIQVFSSRAKAIKARQEYASLMTQYLAAETDGVSIKEMPSASSNKVYRLRLGEITKVLSKAKGVPERAMENGGDWYFVMTSTGIRGYLYSGNTRLVNEKDLLTPLVPGPVLNNTAGVDLIFANNWRPSYFQDMIDSGRYDLDTFSPAFGIFPDAIRKQIRLELPIISKIFTYSDIITRNGNFVEYVFYGSRLVIRIIGTNSIAISWQQNTEEPADSETYKDTGIGGRASFILIQKDIRELYKNEVQRQYVQLRNFISRVGTSWNSKTAGTLNVRLNKTFTWTGRELLKEYFDTDYQDQGVIACRVFLDPVLSDRWEGVFSLQFFTKLGNVGRWKNFFYRLSPEGLVLSLAGDDIGFLTPGEGHTPPLVFSSGI